MGQVIARSASTDRIAADLNKTLTQASARGGEIKAVAEARLLDLQVAMNANGQQLDEAHTKGDTEHATLMACDHDSDLEIGTVLDEIWNALGRAAQSTDYKLIADPSKKYWTNGDPAEQPQLMTVLAAKIRASSNASIADRKEAWAVRIENKAAPQALAAAPQATTDAQIQTLAMQRRTLANAAQVGLTRLKRDYKNLGLTEAQVHEIIPDASKPPRPVPPKPDGTPDK